MKKGTFFLVTSIALGASSAYADDLKGVDLGSGWRFLPELDASVLHDSNLYSQEHDKQATTAEIVAPKLGLEFLTPSDLFHLGYDGAFGFYDTTNADNYSDNDVTFEAKINQTGHNRLNAKLAHDEGHDPFGTERTETTIPPAVRDRDVDEYSVESARLEYILGAPSSAMNLSLSGDYADKHYDNNRSIPFGSVNIGTRYLDRSTAGGTVGVRYAVSARTSLLLDLRYHAIDFDNVAPASIEGSRDGKEYRARAGVQWIATEKVVGRILLGGFWRDNDEQVRKDFNSFDWDAQIIYRPVTYSRITLQTSHSTLESYFDQANFIDVKAAGAKWTHDWSDRFQTGLSGYYYHYEFKGAGRKDGVFAGSVYGRYELTRWLAARASFDANNRDSDVSGLDFDRYIAQFRLELAI
ncbi:MAG TPA: outer membrane beta-barrel protein [Solimonas sp.]|nr:outer membrane beta-barrel protein [Solimonas sp.]